jgi:hypothetical protein
MNDIIKKLKESIVYCEAARRADRVTLCKLVVKQSIQPRIEDVIKELEELNNLFKVD